MTPNPAPENAPKLLSERKLNRCNGCGLRDEHPFYCGDCLRSSVDIDLVEDLTEEISILRSRERQYAELVAAAEPLLKALEADELLAVEPWEECFPMNCACVVPANVIRRAAAALAALSPVSPAERSE